jgi:hypothetical protein
VHCTALRALHGNDATLQRRGPFHEPGHARPDDEDRRRRLVAFSRHNDTPRHLLIEL